ncbi:hypothetical protein NGM99_16005 [Mesorhizobium sp. RP14(2022)]|uniref:Transmembrane protein n=1 Tax=Mesorhizobium liriopis TaxID=2953882 RepID=A0ABT1C8X4_9HYPH|nr:hypothetical protein [Mesorhizobium liriopis]MCO6051289.1 hypothetical protein [Mesorhizobium liriopis]
MLASVPLLVIPLILFNLGLGAFSDLDPWQQPLLSFVMVQGNLFTLDRGTALVVLALVLLFFELLKSTRTSNASVLDHLLSIFVFVAFLLEFLLVPAAGQGMFLVLTVIALVDVLAGFTVSLRAAGRDVHFG